MASDEKDATPSQFRQHVDKLAEQVARKFQDSKPGDGPKIAMGSGVGKLNDVLDNANERLAKALASGRVALAYIGWVECGPEADDTPESALTFAAGSANPFVLLKLFQYNIPAGLADNVFVGAQQVMERIAVEKMAAVRAPKDEPTQ